MPAFGDDEKNGGVSFCQGRGVVLSRWERAWDMVLGWGLSVVCLMRKWKILLCQERESVDNGFWGVCKWVADLDSWETERQRQKQDSACGKFPILGWEISFYLV